MEETPSSTSQSSPQSTGASSQSSSPAPSSSSSPASSGDYSIASFMSDVKDSPAIDNSDTDATGTDGPIPPTSGAKLGETQGAPQHIEDTPASEDNLQRPDPFAPKNPPRNFEGLDQEEQEMFKRMSYRSYSKLYPIYKQFKESNGKFGEEKLTSLQQELEAARQQRFYDEDGAWTLSPEYKQLSEAEDTIKAEGEYWQEQLALAIKGEPWRPLIRNADGTYAQGNPEEASPQAQAKIMAKYQQALHIQSGLTEKKNSLTTGFKTKHANIQGTIKAFNQRLFSNVDFANKYKAQREAILNEFPSEIRHREEYQLIANLAVAVNHMTTLLSQKAQQNGVRTNVANTARNNGPGNGMSGGVRPGKSDDKLWDTFQKLTGGK